MAEPSGRWISLTWHRRLTADLMHFGKKVPCVAVHREFRLAPVARARKAAAQRLSWTILFAKAFALTAKEHPELRRSYMPLPWAHLYEHPGSVGVITVERADESEPYPVALRLQCPEAMSLIQLDAKLHRFKNTPADEIGTLRKFRRFANLPSPIRYAVWWSILNLSGARRAREAGTFAVTSTASAGAGVLSMFSPTTSNLHFGLLSGDDRLDVRLTFDHRVYDGGQAARTLTRLEEILNDQIAAELLGTPLRAAA